MPKKEELDIHRFACRTSGLSFNSQKVGGKMCFLLKITWRSKAIIQ